MKKHTYSNIKSLAIGNLLVIGSILTLVGCNKASEMNSTINQDEDIEAASQSELLQMINQGDAIEIEVAAPAFAEAEQGEELSILWEQLALLTTNPELRKDLDNTLGITITDTGKNGVLYVNANGDNEPNNTLHVALHNRAFSKMFDDENSMLEMSSAGLNNYADIEVDETEKAVYMAINGYFNLLPDATPNYSNPDATLSRAEFMAMVMRAETPVSDIEADSAFATAVGQNDLNIYAQEVAEYSYLDLDSKSLNNMTYNGTITRAEAAYLLMSHYFADELASVDISSATLKDAKDGGNIAEEQKFIEDATSKDYWKSYELTYALQNPDGGVPTSLYKALVLAEQKGLLSSETRWDEALTKAEAVEFIITAMRQDKSITEFNFSQAKIDDYEVEIEAPVKEESGPVDSTGDDVELEEDDYVEPSQEDIVEPEATPAPEVTQGEGPTEEGVLANLKKQFENGEISQEVYDNCVKYVTDNMTFDGQGGFDIKPSSEPQVITSDTALKLTPGGPDQEFVMEDHPQFAGDYVQ